MGDENPRDFAAGVPVEGAAQIGEAGEKHPGVAVHAYGNDLVVLPRPRTVPLSALRAVTVH